MLDPDRLVKKANENNLQLGVGGDSDEEVIMENEESFDDYSEPEVAGGGKQAAIGTVC